LIATATVYLVVTVTVDRHQIVSGVITALPIAMLHLQKRLWQEDELTIATAPVLEPQQGCDAAGYPRVVSFQR